MRREPPRPAFPPNRIFWFTGPAYSRGVETHKIDGSPVRVYGPEKTIADCFKYRNKIGLDVAIEALKLYLYRRHAKTDEVLRYAAVCRVQRVIRPYLEALLGIKSHPPANSSFTQDSSLGARDNYFPK